MLIEATLGDGVKAMKVLDVSTATHCDDFVRQFESEAEHRFLRRVFIAPHGGPGSSLRYANGADNVLFECAIISNTPGRFVVTVARGRKVSELIRLHSRAPGSIATAYDWTDEGWRTPSGSRLDSHALAVKIIDEAL